MAKLPVTIVGGETLLGHELHDLVAERHLPYRTHSVQGQEGGDRIPTGEDDSAVVLAPLDKDAVAGAAAVLLAGSAASSRKAVKLLRSAGSRAAVIDLTGELDDQPGAKLRCPAIEKSRPDIEASRALHIVPHAGAAVPAEFLTLVHGGFPIQRVVAQVLVPASEQGRRGVVELQKQTVALLSLKKLPKDSFDAQLAFSVLPAYGADAPVPLEQTELRIERHLASLLLQAGGVPMPSVRVLQAPVFHGLSLSLWIEFEEAVDAARIESFLSDAGVDVRGTDLDPPTNVGMTGQTGFAVGPVHTDRNNRRACWLWLAADNFRVSVEIALELLRQLTQAEA